MQISFESIYQAHIRCRRRKRSTVNTQRFEMNLLDHLVSLQTALQYRTWSPARAVRFVVSQPKAREIYAADYSDRVIHHWLVPQLEALYEPIFVFDCWSNRPNKGTHGAVQRLRDAMRSQTRCGEREGFFIQLDIKNFFNSIHKPTLFSLVQQRLRKAVRSGAMAADVAEHLRWLVHAVLKADPVATAVQKGTIKTFESVPLHKRLGATGVDYGLPIGNLTSQFFANVYVNELDQFIKHQLKCRHYVRYVDDFILLADDASQLKIWFEQISLFLAQNLKLTLKEGLLIKNVNEGANFLGYIVRPTHLLVRRRVKEHLEQRLNRFAKQFIRTKQHAGCTIKVLKTNPAQLAALRAQLASYLGHFKHANSYQLEQSTRRKFQWLDALGCANLMQPKYKAQVAAARQQFPAATLCVEKGNKTEMFAPPTQISQPTAFGFEPNQVSFVQGGLLASGRRARHLVSIQWKLPNV